MGINFFRWLYMFSFLYIRQEFYCKWLRVTLCAFYKKKKCLLFLSTCTNPKLLGCNLLLILLVFVLFFVLFPMLPVPLAFPFFNAPSVYSYVYVYHIHDKNNDNRNIPSASLELSIAASSKLSVDAISLWSTPLP
jgi:hypothetical protein